MRRYSVHEGKVPVADDACQNFTEKNFTAFKLPNHTIQEIEEVKLLLLLPYNSTGPTLRLY